MCKPLQDCDPSGYVIVCLEEDYQEAFIKAYTSQNIKSCMYRLIFSEFDDGIVFYHDDLTTVDV